MGSGPLAGVRIVLFSSPARPGEHTRDVLLEWGITDVDELLTAGVVIQS